MKKILVLVLCCSAFAVDPNKTNDWSNIKRPRGEFPQSIGSYANGCQTGAKVLPEHGKGFQSIRRWRNRFYAQQSTLDLIHHIGAAIAPRKILVGDMSLPIGGLMPFGHSSHQNGLDVDIWFYSIGENEFLNKDVEPPTMVNKAVGTMYLERWRPEYRHALFIAATYPNTARIFVNPVIKQYLCDTEIDRSWLRKIRPWGGHDSHFHIRLVCPLDNPYCENQAAIPLGDGCDADLVNWIRDQSDAILKSKPQRQPKRSKPKPIHPLCLDLMQNGASF